MLTREAARLRERQNGSNCYGRRKSCNLPQAGQSMQGPGTLLCSEKARATCLFPDIRITHAWMLAATGPTKPKDQQSNSGIKPGRSLSRPRNALSFCAVARFWKLSVRIKPDMPQLCRRHDTATTIAIRYLRSSQPQFMWVQLPHCWQGAGPDKHPPDTRKLQNKHRHPKTSTNSATTWAKHPKHKPDNAAMKP